VAKVMSGLGKLTLSLFIPLIKNVLKML